MSWHNWTIDGYGICVDDIAETMLKKDMNEQEKIARLCMVIRTAPAFEKFFEEWLKESYEDKTTYTFNELLDFEDENCYSGLGAILNQVILEVEDIQTCLCDDFNGYQYIVLTPAYPWQKVSDTEKALTPQALDNIFNKYSVMLCGEEVHADYQAVENGG